MSFYSNSRVTLCDSLTRIAKGTMSEPYELQIIRLQLHLVNHMVKMGNQLALQPGPAAKYLLALGSSHKWHHW